jgi:hypothetical protein
MNVKKSGDEQFGDFFNDLVVPHPEEIRRSPTLNQKVSQCEDRSGVSLKPPEPLAAIDRISQIRNQPSVTTFGFLTKIPIEYYGHNLGERFEQY